MSQLILSMHYGLFHDSGAAVSIDYDIRAAVQLERLTRKKGDGDYPDKAIDEVLSIMGASRRDVDVLAISRTDFPVRYFKHFRGWRRLREQWRTHVAGKPLRFLPRETVRTGNPNVEDFFDVDALRHDMGLREDAKVYFYNHHTAHALPTLFFTDWDDALLVTSDGGGDSVNHSHRRFRDGRIEDIYGTDAWLTQPYTIDSLGHAYGGATRALGFRMNRHEGKLTGLSAFGQPTHAEEIARHFRVDENGRIFSDFRRIPEMYVLMQHIAKKAPREDVAASIQKVLEDTMLTSISRLLRKYPARHLGVAGGIFANVRLNRVLAEKLPIDEIFIFPPMGDEGLPVGGVLAYLLHRDGMTEWLKHRHRLRHVYLGRDFSRTADSVIAAMPTVRISTEAPVAGAASRLASGQIGGLYTGRMELGPRALGARTILGNPSQRATHDLLNSRLERSEFMPFAPVVAAENAKEVFAINSVNAYASRFMTITCDVHPSWREEIAAVVHVDNSARPQVIERDANPLYYNIIEAFRKQTGIPVLVNTSFNVHEEPIVNTPEESGRALVDGRIDFIVTEKALYIREGSAGSV
jgi:carbamoyltransferase